MLVTSPLGIMGPAGLAPAVTSRLQEAFRGWTQTEEYRNTLDQFVLGPWFRTGAQVEALMKIQFDKDRDFAERAGILVRR